MNNQNKRVFELAVRMSSFATLHGGDFPPDSVAAQKFKTLNELIAKSDLFGTRQAQEKGSAKALTEAKKFMRDDIRRQMRAYRETALSIESERPGVSQNFKLPTSASDASLIEAARAFVGAATPLKALFLSREMPENFLEALTEAIQKLERAVNSHHIHRGNRSAARTLLDDTCSQVLSLRRELDPIVRNKHRNDPEKLTLWELASHLERPPKKGASNGSNGKMQSPSDGKS